MLPAAVPMEIRAPVPWALWRDHQDGYAAPLEQQLSRSSCGDGRWVRGSGGDDGARGGHGAGGCRGWAGAARRRQREVKRASVERRLRIAPAASDRTSGFGSPQQRHLSKLDLNWVTFFVNHGKPHRGRKFSQAVGGARPDLRITPRWSALAAFCVAAVLLLLHLTVTTCSGSIPIIV